MSWSYRLVRYRGDVGYGLHEVYFRDDGRAWSMTENPATFEGDEPEEVLAALDMAVEAARQRPVFDEPETWAPREPA